MPSNNENTYLYKACHSLLRNIKGDRSASEIDAINYCRSIIIDLPFALKIIFDQSRDYKIRCSCVVYSRRYCRVLQSAIRIATTASLDRSKYVRYRAYELFACSQHPECIQLISNSTELYNDQLSLKYASAAIDSIKSKNINYFIDHKHTGRSFLKYTFLSTTDLASEFGREWFSEAVSQVAEVERIMRSLSDS